MVTRSGSIPVSPSPKGRSIIRTGSIISSMYGSRNSIASSQVKKPSCCARIPSEGNGTTFDPQGRLIQCEGGNRRVTRWPADGTFASSDVLMDRFDGKRLSRPNDVVCKSVGSVYFTNPGLRIPLGERELVPSAVYRIMPDGSNKHVADFEYPNGLAFSP